MIPATSVIPISIPIRSTRKASAIAALPPLSAINGGRSGSEPADTGSTSTIPRPIDSTSSAATGAPPAARAISPSAPCLKIMREISGSAPMCCIAGTAAAGNCAVSKARAAIWMSWAVPPPGRSSRTTGAISGSAPTAAYIVIIRPTACSAIFNLSAVIPAACRKNASMASSKTGRAQFGRSANGIFTGWTIHGGASFAPTASAKIPRPTSRCPHRSTRIPTAIYGLPPTRACSASNRRRRPLLPSTMIRAMPPASVTI